jgi:MoxR-like ATPase
MNAERLHEVLTNARNEVAKILVGQQRVVDLSMITILTGSHALIEGVPGTGKTLLVRTLARILDCESNRIQFTPDLMPADILGTNIFNMKTHEFTLVKGPVFTSFLLGDEINRAPAKTQSALLQAMQERQVTIDRETLPLPNAFTVFATQNPIEYEGTYPLPEAQKDRFMFKIPMGCPERDEEISLAHRFLGPDAPETMLKQGAVQSVIRADELPALKAAFEEISLRSELIQYVVDLVRLTRNHPSILVGAGPRATQALLLGARAEAVLEGRDFVTPDDVRDLLIPTLAHRLVLRPEFELEGLSVEEVIIQLANEVPIPR